MSIYYPTIENDTRTVLDYENTVWAHEYAEKNFPEQYKNRNCRMGFHNEDYYFISHIITAYKSGLEKVQNGKQ